MFTAGETIEKVSMPAAACLQCTDNENENENENVPKRNETNQNERNG